MNSFMNQGAMESMFDPELTATKLLEAVRENVSNSVKTVDAAASLEDKLSEEAARFNECLTNMSNAIHKCERGEISREEMLAECAPCAAALKEKCTAINLGGIHTTGDDITEEEIAMLREYIVGCKDIVAARKKELQDCQCAASEGLMSALADYEPATEGVLKTMPQIRNSNEAKTANQLYKQAKKLYGLGSKEQAVTYLKQAKGLYEKCLKTAEENAKMYTAERTRKVAYATSVVEDKAKRKVTDSTSTAYVIEYFEDRIDSCKALELQWNNKAGKSTYAETKAQLKEERKQAKASYKASRKAARKESFNAKKDAIKAKFSKKDAEAIEALGMTEEEFIEAMESMMDSIELEISYDAAMEADGEEAEAPKAGGIFSKIRNSLSKLRKADTSTERSEAADELKEAANELEDAAAEAKTPEEKKRLSKAAKGGIAAAATAAITYGLYALGNSLKKKADDGSLQPNAVAKLLIKLADTLKRKPKIKADVMDAVKDEGTKLLGGGSGSPKLLGGSALVPMDPDYVRGRRQASRIINDYSRHPNSSSGQINLPKYALPKDENGASLKGADVKRAVMDIYKAATSKLKLKKSPNTESFLGLLWDEYALEAFLEGEDIDDYDEIDNMEGRAFYDEDDIIENAEESELDDLATEAAIAVMMAEDGIDDSDLL